MRYSGLDVERLEHEPTREPMRRRRPRLEAREVRRAGRPRVVRRRRREVTS